MAYLMALPTPKVQRSADTVEDRSAVFSVVVRVERIDARFMRGPDGSIMDEDSIPVANL